MLEAGVRMAQCYMLRRVHNCRDTVDMFNMAKAAKWVAEQLEVELRLAFDLREGNLNRKGPLWTVLSGPDAIASLNLSGCWSGEVEFNVSAGDVVVFYLAVRVAAEISEFFCMPLVSGAVLDAVIRNVGLTVRK